jgi:Pyridoxamine 5'-phosphate oxidase
VLDPSKPAHAHAERRLRTEPIVWLTTVRADGRPQSSPVWFLWDGDGYLARYRAAIEDLGYEAEPFARTYSTAIRVHPTRARVW